MKIKFHLAATSILFVVAFVIVLQAFSPKIEQKPAVNELNDVPQEVALILKRSCFNCHSNTQNLTIWDQIAPISWLVSKDVNRAREVVNFSNWDDFSAAEKKSKFFAMYNMVQKKKMPLPSYTLFHTDATLSSREINSIKQYAILLAHQDSVIPLQDITPPIELTKAAVARKERPISPNGIAYDDAFKHWTVIGMSTLIDNSIRVIYANDIAVQAIANEDFHPWPDGSMVAKAVWKQTKTQNGDIVPGEFVNVQYMEKKSREYNETEGWGFAKFNGQNLKHTGNSVVFAQQSCISCHRQLAESTGYLFNVPPKVNTKKRIAQLKP